jgi:hypothetical protein
LGVTLLTRPYTGFGIAILDVYCDGKEEIIQANGRVAQLDSAPPLMPPAPSDSAERLREFWAAYSEHSQLLHRVDGRFEDATDQSGDFGRWVGIGRGLAVGDLNGDGRPDLVAIDFANRAKVFLNAVKPRGHWISVRAVDPTKGGRDALGALVTVVVGEKRLAKRIRTCGSYQSASEPCAHFGLGETRRIDCVKIAWPDGEFTPEKFEAPALDQSYTFKRKQGTRAK